MDCERYQDLSGWALFGSASAEVPGPTTDTTMHTISDYQKYPFDNSMDLFNDFNGTLYPMTRSDSLDEIKGLATAPMEVVPMREHEAFQIQNQVKREYEATVGREEEVGAAAETEVDLKFEADFPYCDADSSLLSEVGDDLVQYIVSEVSYIPLELDVTLH